MYAYFVEENEPSHEESNMEKQRNCQDNWEKVLWLCSYKLYGNILKGICLQYLNAELVLGENKEAVLDIHLPDFPFIPLSFWLLTVLFYSTWGKELIIHSKLGLKLLLCYFHSCVHEQDTWLRLHFLIYK